MSVNGMEHNTVKGIILKGVGGFYDVFLTDSKEILNCKLRGKLRLNDDGILCGDQVLVSLQETGQGMIEEVLPRENRLQRPKVANLEQAILVMAAKNPAPDWLLLDKMIITAFYNDIVPVICFNKCDLLSGALLVETKQILSGYQKVGFKVFVVSSKHKTGIAELLENFKGRFSVLAGQSGVGKSSLLNALFPSLGLTVGEISQKLKRGKHTTRHVEIWPLIDDILVADTPGFSLLDLPDRLEPEQLAQYYPEFCGLKACRFDGCLHDKEPDCKVKQAVESGRIDEKRYQRYLKLLYELKDREVEYR